MITAIPYVRRAGDVPVVTACRSGTRACLARRDPTLLGGLAIPVALYLRHPVAVMIPVTSPRMGVRQRPPGLLGLPSRFLTGAAAAAGIGLINSFGNLGGFAAPYATGALVRSHRKQPRRHVGGRDHGGVRGPGRRTEGHPRHRMVVATSPNEYSRLHCAPFRPVVFAALRAFLLYDFHDLDCARDSMTFASFFEKFPTRFKKVSRPLLCSVIAQGRFPGSKSASRAQVLRSSVCEI